MLFPGAQSLIVIRALRLLRVFRVLKLAHFVREARVLNSALRASSRKITVFLGAVLTMVLIIGSLMYLIEGERSGFTNIPQGIYWAIVTMTTVGYGDIAPVTVLGKVLASAVMILGYGIIAQAVRHYTVMPALYGARTRARCQILQVLRCKALIQQLETLAVRRFSHWSFSCRTLNSFL